MVKIPPKGHLNKRSVEELQETVFLGDELQDRLVINEVHVFEVDAFVLVDGFLRTTLKPRRQTLILKYNGSPPT